MNSFRNLENVLKVLCTCHQSVDGKEARGSGRSEDTKNPQRNINVLNVYSNSDCLCIHSKPVETKTNEIPVAQEILRMMELKKDSYYFLTLYIHKEKHVISLRQKKRHLCSTCKKIISQACEKKF